uniref:CYCLIN domain-containing protein n=1 Tax=Heterorhabditis bacteriophora TaxID=37862 RepID=A0A1I7X8Y0_HETBA
MSTLAEKRNIALAKMQAFVIPKKVDHTEKKEESADVQNEQFDTSDKPSENELIRPSSFGLRPLYSRVDINCDKWLLTMDEASRAKLENPPSLADGLDIDAEAVGDSIYNIIIYYVVKQILAYFIYKENAEFFTMLFKEMAIGCELIQVGAILLRLPQTAAATGQILYQRFYYQKSFVRYRFEHTVMACLLLASKIEEEPRRPRDVYNVFHRMEQLHRLRQAGRSINK